MKYKLLFREEELSSGEFYNLKVGDQLEFVVNGRHRFITVRVTIDSIDRSEDFDGARCQFFITDKRHFRADGSCK